MWWRVVVLGCTSLEREVFRHMWPEAASHLASQRFDDVHRHSSAERQIFYAQTSPTGPRGLFHPVLPRGACQRMATAMWDFRMAWMYSTVGHNWLGPSQHQISSCSASTPTHAIGQCSNFSPWPGGRWAPTFAQPAHAPIIA